MSKASNKVAGLEVKKKMKTIENMRKYSIKNKDELELLDVNFALIKDRPSKVGLFDQLQKKHHTICILWKACQSWYFCQFMKDYFTKNKNQQVRKQSLQKIISS